MPPGLGAKKSTNPLLDLNDSDSEDERPSHGKPNHLAVQSSTTKGQDDDDGDDGSEEEDYMKYVVPEDTRKGETSLQRATRLKREAEARGRPKPKAELEREEAIRREKALRTRLDSNNRGFKMMAKLGFREGDALGPVARDAAEQRETSLEPSANSANDDGADDDKGWGKLTEPLAVEIKTGKEGIGMTSEKKRKFLDQVDTRISGEKRAKEEVGDYRVRQAYEREELHCERLLVGAQKVAIGLADDARTVARADGANADTEAEVWAQEQQEEEEKKALKAINVLWRGLIRYRREMEREKRMRVDLINSLSRLPGYEPNTDEDAQDELAYDGKLADPKSRKEQVLESELDEEDEELQEFVALPAKDRLARVVAYLREKWWYCFWCKMRYDTADMEGCPGIEEDEHD